VRRCLEGRVVHLRYPPSRTQVSCPVRFGGPPLVKGQVLRDILYGSGSLAAYALSAIAQIIAPSRSEIAAMRPSRITPTHSMGTGLADTSLEEPWERSMSTCS
jgi:hypothetical protein